MHRKLVRRFWLTPLIISFSDSLVRAGAREGSANSVVDLSRGQDYIPCDHEAHGAAEKDVAWEMVAAGDASEADCAGHAVRHPGNPAMITVAVGNDRGDCKRGHGVHGIKPAGVERIVRAVKKAIGIRAVARVLQGLLSAGNALERQVERETVRESFRGKERRGLCVGVLFYETDGIDRRGNSGDECRGVHTTEGSIEAAEAVRRPEVRSAVRVGSDECGGDTHNGYRRKPVLGFGQMSGKEPNLLLIGGKIRGESAQGDLAIRCGGDSRPRLLRGRGRVGRVGELLRQRRSRRAEKGEQKASACCAANWLWPNHSSRLPQ